LEFLNALKEQGDITRIFLGRRPMYFVGNPKLVRTVLVNRAQDFDKGGWFDELRPYLGNGLITSAGAFHRRQRLLVQPAFAHNRVAQSFGAVISDLAAARTGSWGAGQELRIDREMDDLVFQMLARLMFSDDADTALTSEIRFWLEHRIGAMERVLSPLPHWLDSLPIPGRRRFDPTAATQLARMMDEVICLRRETPQADLVSLLLRSVDRQRRGMSDLEVRDELITLLVAGTETTSATLAWVFHDLAWHPDVAARLIAEVDREVGSGPVDATGIARLSYTRRVIQEVLRRRSVVWLLNRRALTTVPLGETILEPGDEIMFSPYAIHHDPAVYPDPEQFAPDRWLPDAPAPIPRSSFIPFGAGNRICIGEGLAWAELLTVVATVVRKWRLVPVTDTPSTPHVGTLIRPGTLPMTVRARGSVR
jgi:cytochrome P450